MYNVFEPWNQSKLSLENIKKCAIFVHYSIDDPKKIEEKKNKLVKFCEEVLQTTNYEVFIEIGSFLKNRKVFNDMLKQFKKGEFSHLVITEVGQIYKLSYSIKKAIQLTTKIQHMNITTICVDEGRFINALSNPSKER